MINPFNALIRYADQITGLFPHGSDEVAPLRVDVDRLLRLREAAGLGYDVIPNSLTEVANPHGQRVQDILFRLAKTNALEDPRALEELERGLARQLYTGRTLLRPDRLGFSLKGVIELNPSSLKCLQLYVDPETQMLKGAFRVFFGSTSFDLKTTFTGSRFTFPLTPEGIQSVDLLRKELYQEVAARYDWFYRKQSWFRLKAMKHPVAMVAGLAVLSLVVGASRVDRGSSSTFVDS